ncbi:hypothetical protein AB0M02_20965 [Actinoplanes sp. NPDC051861]|uniref:hypothetical protein n=1 Tax=Actinoplanes sp. NPDC051861 TaxID=3155170 RepID=UPI00343BCE9C
MAFVGIDVQGTRALGQVLLDVAGRTEQTRRQAVAALGLADLTGQSPTQLTLVHEGLKKLGNGVLEKADLAERFTIDPQQTAASLGATPAELSGAIAGLLGFAGPRSLRDVLRGLPPKGASAALDAALARLSPLLLGSAAPKLPEPPPAELVADLQLLAKQLGIEHVGPPAPAEIEVSGKGFFGALLRRVQVRDGTEVFYNDFWSDGRTVAEVLANPAQLLAWISGTVELDRRMHLAAGLPTLADALDSYEFARGESGARPDLTAIESYLPALLTGRTSAAPDAAQLAQTLAFATYVGWKDPGGTDSFASAIAYLRANRILESALLPTGFEGDTQPLAFFNAAGIAATLQLGRDSGVLDPAYLTGLGSLLDRLAAAVKLDFTGAPPELTETLQQQLFALVASQIPRSLADSPAIQSQFIASLGHLRQATSGADLRLRILDVVAAFRTIAVVGAPALTERQLTAIVGDQVLGVLGRSRLRLRNEGAIRSSPEFLLVARQFGIPGSRKEEIGKYKFSFSFDELGVLTGIRRKKKSWLSRAWDSIKAVGKAILESWKDNPFKAIFQVGKIALGALSLVVPGLQVVGAASLALSLGEAAYHAIEGDWLAAIGAGLSAFTAGTNIFGTAVDALQGTVLEGVFNSSMLDVLRNAKRAFDIGTSVLRFTQADGLLDTVTAGLGAAGSILGNGGQIIGSLGLDKQFAEDLVRLGTTVLDVNRVAAPVIGVIEAIRKGDLLAAFGSGLAAISAGAAAVANPKGVLSGKPGESLFEFAPGDREALQSLAQGTGVAASLARAIKAADTGNAFQAGAALAEAARILNGPRQPGDPQDESLGNPAELAKRVAELGAVLEAVFKGANPAVAAPIVVRQLGRVVDALNPAPPPKASQPQAVGGVAAPLPGISVTAPGTNSIPTPVPSFGGLPLPVPGDLPFPAPGASPAPGVDSIPEPVPGIVVGDARPIALTTFAAADDSLVGGAGSDTLAGGDGDDTLTEVRTVFAAETTAAVGLLGDDPEIRTTPFPFVWRPEAPLSVVEAVGTEVDPAVGNSDPGSVFGNPVVRTTPMPFLWLGQPETQLNTPIDWSQLATPAFTPNPIMEGGSRTQEGMLLIAGGGTSVQGPWEASHSVYGGAKLGAQYVDNNGGPVDGVTLTANVGAGLQRGPYGFNVQVTSDVNVSPILDGQWPIITNDTIAGVNLPYIGAVGFRATNGDIRWVEQSDFASAWGGGVGAMAGVKFPVGEGWALDRIAEMSGLAPEQVQMVRDAPDGTRLAFDVSPDFSGPFQPPFGQTLDMGEPNPAEPALGGGFSSPEASPEAPAVPGDGGTFVGGGGTFLGGGATGDIPLVPDGITLDFGGLDSFGLSSFNAGPFDDYNLADYGFGDYDFAGSSAAEYGITDYGFANLDFGSYEF